MGTSTSSNGGRAGSPFDPEWLAPDGTAPSYPDSETQSDPEQDNGEGAPDSDSPVAGENVIAPDRRFGSARSQMGSYLKNGNRDNLRGAIRSMVSKGMGGASRAASTMRSTAKGAGALGQFLEAARDGKDPQVTDWVARCRAANLSASDLALEVLKEVISGSGSIDEESLRDAGTNALAKLYENHPNVDIFDLSDAQIAEVIGLTIANQICQRIDMQLGQTYEKLKHDPAQIQERRTDIREWVWAEVRVTLEEKKASHTDPKNLAQSVLQSALQVFAE
ncbi:Qat anti-phage system associated protein QatB [Vreelandella titanicae]|uniref:Qat anti-phage system associated protein QatB n=1 Tax=Vreelandella titanicae TaxID=664683 RepID=UPI0039BEF7BB